MKLQKKEKKRIKILIVDDHEAIGAGLISLGNIFKKLNFIGTCKTGNEAMEFLKINETDVIIMDISLKNEDGLVLTENILKIYQKIKIIIYSIHDDYGSVQRALKAGAIGYFTKASDSSQFMHALDEIEKIEDGVPICSEDIDKIMKRYYQAMTTNKSPILKEIDNQIIIKICDGKTLKEIGNDLGLSEKRISSKRKELLEILNLENDADLIKYAIRERLISNN